jgi:ABC-type nickel/cobalt efflux system permease component RcnA
VEPTAVVFLAAACATAALHALIPDHWLPFVLMGRSRKWSVAKTLGLASAGGLLHVCLAVALGVLTYRLGREGAEAAARRLGETLEVLSSLGLAAFGFLYGGYSWYRERRHHPPNEEHSKEMGAARDPHHHHGHLLERWFGGDLTGWSLVTVIGVSPCALAFPVLLASAASLGIGGVLLVATGFGVVTMLVTLAVTLIGSLSARKIDFPFLSRYGDLIGGILIGVVGVILFAWEVIGR